MVTGRSIPQRWLHTFVSMLCGEDNSCGIKIDYRSQPSAEKAAVKVSKKFQKQFDVYQCWFCRGWHVGNAQNLTFRKFWRIFWFWLLQRKRTGPKQRNYTPL